MNETGKPATGSPLNATEEMCDCCGDIFPLVKLTLSESGQWLCQDCGGMTQAIETPWNPPW
jgi:hypothetical protein